MWSQDAETGLTAQVLPSGNRCYWSTQDGHTAAGSARIRKAEKGRFQAVGAVFAKTLEAPEGTAC